MALVALNSYVSAYSSLLPDAQLGFTNRTKYRWTQRLVSTAADPGAGARLRLTLTYVAGVNLYSLFGPGGERVFSPGDYLPISTPGQPAADYYAGFFTCFPFFQPDDQYRYAGIIPRSDPNRLPRIAHKFSNIDGIGVRGTASGGTTTTLQQTTYTWGANTKQGRNIIVNPDTALEESRKIIAHPANELAWTTPLSQPVGPGTAYEIRVNSTQLVNRNPLKVPIDIAFELEKLGTVTNPTGRLWRNAFTGIYKEGLSGTYSLWRLYATLEGFGRMMLADFLLDSAVEAHSQTIGWDTVFRPRMELSYDDATAPLSNMPTEWAFKDVAFYDESARQWYVVNKFKITTGIATPEDCGWNPQLEVGNLSFHVGKGLEGHLAQNKYLLFGLLPRNASTGAVLAADGIQTILAGALSYTGFRWRTGTADPSILQAEDFGYWLLHPSATQGAALVYRATRDATYTFTGAFARANSAAFGNGVDVRVVTPGGTAFSGTIPSAAGTTQSNPFADAGAQSFAISRRLRVGQEASFEVHARGDAGFDLTALQLEVQYAEPGFFSGDSGLVAAAGTDRAVECPRCGHLILESRLTQDGVQRGLLVCPSCYDPPTPPPNWRWPFRK